MPRKAGPVGTPSPVVATPAVEVAAKPAAAAKPKAPKAPKEAKPQSAPAAAADAIEPNASKPRTPKVAAKPVEAAQPEVAAQAAPQPEAAAKPAETARPEVAPDPAADPFARLRELRARGAEAMMSTLRPTPSSAESSFTERIASSASAAAGRLAGHASSIVQDGNLTENVGRVAGDLGGAAWDYAKRNPVAVTTGAVALTVGAVPAALIGATAAVVKASKHEGGLSGAVEDVSNRVNGAVERFLFGKRGA